jgi:hypothetical protein
MAYNTYPQTVSSKVRTTPPLSADPGRYLFLNLTNAEPNLSLPAYTSNNAQVKYFLLSDPINGTRFWSTSATIALSGDKIGIGTDKPNEKLTVVGNISATGNLYGNIVTPVVPAAAGSNDFVQFNEGGFLAADPGFLYKLGLSALQVGVNNSTTGAKSSILGGSSNFVLSQLATIAGGEQNTVSGTSSIIGAGAANEITGDYAVIAGGRNNLVGNTFSVVVGGQNNEASGYAASILGGQNNVIQGGADLGAILGGENNLVQHDNAFIIGSNRTSVSANYTYTNNLDIGGQTVMNGSIAEQFVSSAPALSSVNISLSAGTSFNITLNTNVSSFNVTDIILNKVNSFLMFINQDSVGGRTVTFNFVGKSVIWAGGNVPTVTASASATDIYTFISKDSGATWYGFVGGQNFI